MKSKLDDQLARLATRREDSVQHIQFLRRENGRSNGWLFKSGKNTDKLVILVHGTGNDALVPYLSIIASLLKSGFAVFTFDLDGHGRHSTTSLCFYRLSSCLPDAIESCHGRWKFKSFYLLGHSFGGVLILQYLKRVYHRKPAAVVMISTPVRLTLGIKDMLSELASLKRSSVYRQAWKYGLAYTIPAVGPFKRNRFPIRFLDSDDHSKMSYIRFVREYTEGVFKNLEAVQEFNEKSFFIPLLLCYGGADRLTPSSHGKEIGKRWDNSFQVEAKGETHFSTIFSSIVENSIVNFLLDLDFP